MKTGIYIIAVCLMLTSCDIVKNRHIKGNGSMTTKDYSLTGFKGLQADGDLDVTIKQDSAFSIKVTTDNNLFQYLRVNVNDGMLEIDNENEINLDPTGSIKVVITMPVVSDLDISGSSELRTDGRIQQDAAMRLSLSGASSGNITARAPKIDMDISGASTLNISGETRDISVDVSGASTLNAYALKSETAGVTASGASHARVFASMKLNADASGASGIMYKGSPNVTSEASGAGSVSKSDDK